jgi:hypothetical protein
MIKSYCHFDLSFKSDRRDLLIIELGFYINPKENGLRKLVQKFSRDQMVGSKVINIFARY